MVPTASTDRRPLHSALMGVGPAGRETCWKHGGFWGSLAIYCPASDTTIVVSWNQASHGPYTLTNGEAALADRLARVVQSAD